MKTGNLTPESSLPGGLPEHPRNLPWAGTEREQHQGTRVPQTVRARQRELFEYFLACFRRACPPSSVPMSPPQSLPKSVLSEAAQQAPRRRLVEERHGAAQDLRREGGFLFLGGELGVPEAAPPGSLSRRCPGSPAEWRQNHAMNPHQELSDCPCSLSYWSGDLFSPAVCYVWSAYEVRASLLCAWHSVVMNL